MDSGTYSNEMHKLLVMVDSSCGMPHDVPRACSSTQLDSLSVQRRVPSFPTDKLQAFHDSQSLAGRLFCGIEGQKESKSG